MVNHARCAGRKSLKRSPRNDRREGGDMSDKKGAMKRRIPCARCVWREDENGNWETGCGETFCFDDGGVRPNKHYFCPNCGKPIDEVKYEGEEA